MIATLALLGVSAHSGDGGGDQGVTAIAIVASALLWPIVVTFSFRRLSSEQKQITYKIDAKGIAMRDLTGAATAIPWTIVRRVIESRAGFAVAVKPAGLRWLPKRAFTEEALAGLRATFRQTLGKAARVRD